MLGARRDGGTSTARLRVGPLSCTTDDVRLGRWFDLCRPWAERWGAHGGITRRVSWERIHGAGQPPALSERLWGSVGAGLVDDRPVFAGPADGTVRIDADTVTVEGEPDPEEAGWRLLLEAVLFELLGGAGCVCVHGGAVALADAGWLVAGDSGAGKSTFVHLASGVGAEAVSDDVTLLHRTGGRWWAYGTSTSVRLAPASHLPEIDGSAALDERGKVRVPTPASRSRVPLAAVLLLEGARDGVSRRRPLEAGATLRRLLGQAALALEPGAAQAQCDLLEALAGEVPAWSVRSGRDLLDRPARTLELLEAP